MLDGEGEWGNLGVEYSPEAHAADDGQEYIFLEYSNLQNQTICMYEWPVIGGDGDEGISLEITIDDTYMGQLFFYNYSKKEIEEKYISKTVEIIKCIEDTYKTGFDNSYEPRLK